MRKIFLFFFFVELHFSNRVACGEGEDNFLGRIVKIVLSQNFYGKCVSILLACSLLDNNLVINSGSIKKNVLVQAAKLEYFQKKKKLIQFKRFQSVLSSGRDFL